MTISLTSPNPTDAAEASRPSVGVVAVDAEGFVRHLDAAAEIVTGWPLSEALGRSVEEVVCLADDERRPQPQVSAREWLMASQDPTRRTLLSRDGEARIVERIVELSSARIVDARGRLASVVLTVRDTQAHDPIALANHRLRMVVQGMPIMLDAFDENRLISVWNTECERVTGFSAEEVIGNPDAMLLMYPDPEYREYMLEEWTKRGSNYRNWAWELTCKDGSKRTIEWSNVSADLPIPGWTTWGVGVDITERLRLEANVRQSQKMEAIGQLAGGVAHDFNNLLTVINGCAEEIIMELAPQDSETSTLAKMIVDTAARASMLTRQLLLFSRRGTPRVATLDLNEVVRRGASLLARTLGEQVLLRMEFGENLGSIRGDATQVEQIIFNLCLNARDAMPTGGPLVLSTDTAVIDEGDLDTWPQAKPGRFVLLSVADAGVGMSDHVKAHLFEPFFTTKATGQGTGLGLATVFGIVQRMEGFIVVDSRVGAGTTMRVFLPETRAVREATAPTLDHQERVGGHETLLLVEDDVSLRRLVARRLAGSGYRVLEAINGDEAVAVAVASGHEVDLLLTDLVMPGKSGRETAAALRARLPKLRVLFMSGYDPEADEQSLDGRLLQKPFTMSELLGRIRAVLDGEQAR